MNLWFLLAPSGCGKSTLLRLMSGLEELTSGEIYIDGVRVDHLPPARRGLAMVFQSYALYPHMSVYQNMSYALKVAKKSKQEIDEKVRAAAEILQLTELLDRRPKALSGRPTPTRGHWPCHCARPKRFPV